MKAKGYIPVAQTHNKRAKNSQVINRRCSKFVLKAGNKRVLSKTLIFWS
jgi:hypothetical protein